MAIEIQKAKLPELKQPTSTGWTSNVTKQIKRSDCQDPEALETGWQGKVEVYGHTVDPTHTFLVGGRFNGKFRDFADSKHLRLIEIEGALYELGDKRHELCRYHCGSKTADSITLSERIL